MKKTIFLVPLIGALVLLGAKVLSQPSSGPGGQGSYNVPSTGGGGGSVSNYNQLNPLFFNTLTTTNGLTNISTTTGLFLTNPAAANESISLLPGAAPGSSLTLGTANGLSAVLLSSSGSNNMSLQAGYGTNNWLDTNGLFYILDATFLRNSLGVGGTFSTTNGGFLGGIFTNVAGPAIQTNALTWSTIQATNENTFWAFATNVTIAGWQNIEQSHIYRGDVDFSNGAAANVTVTWPAGTRLMGGFTTNQPLNTCTVTNGKLATAHWKLNSHLGQSITQVWWSTQQN